MSGEAGEMSQIQPRTDSCVALAKMSPLVVKAFAVQCSAYFAFMLLFVYGSVWVGSEVFDGAANASLTSAKHLRFVAGVTVANRGFLLMAILSIIISLGLPAMLHVFGYRPIWSLSLLTLGLSLISTKRISSTPALYTIFAIMSLSMACSFTIPWTIVSVAFRKEGTTHIGRQMATFNLSQAIPGLLAALMGSLVLKVGGEVISNVLVMGGVSAVLGSVLVWWTEVPEELT